MKIIKNTLIQNYAQSMGIEAARELVTKKIKSADLDEKEHYTEEETAKIYGELIKEGGLISTVTQNLLVKLERKRLEEQTLLLDNIENQIWYLTDKKTYGIVNKAHAEFIGLEKEQLEGKDLHDIISVEAADIFIANNREVFEKKKQSHTEEWIKNGRGDTRLLSITRTPKLNGNGDVEYVICAAEDITERKQAVEALWESEEKYRTLIENLEEVIVSFSLDGTISYCSPNVKKFGGYNAEEEIGHHFSRYIVGDEAIQKLQELFQDIILKKKPVSFEFLFKPKSKEPFYVEATASPNISGISNAIVSIQCIIRDITERKQAEEALQKSEEKFRLLTENSVDCVWMLDKKLSFIYLSPSTERILGYKPEQMIGTNLSSHFKTKEFLKIAAMAANAIKNYKTFTHFTFETKMLNSKKDEVDIEITSRLLFNNKGKLLGLQGLTRDITERKQAEEELKESEDKSTKLTEQLPVAISVLDNNENTVYANRKYLETIGYFYKNQNLSNWFLRAYPDEEYRKWVIEKWYADIEKSTKEGKDVEPFEYNVTCKDGKVRIMEISGTWIGDNFVTIFNDVTGRVQAEAELQQLNEELEQRVIERTAELKENNKDLERMVKAFTGREIRMAELKGIIKDLEEQIASWENKRE